MYKGTVYIQKEALRISQNLDGLLWVKSFQMCYHALYLECWGYLEPLIFLPFKNYSQKQ